MRRDKKRFKMQLDPPPKTHKQKTKFKKTKKKGEKVEGREC